MECEHKTQIGDNYGISCQDCGRVLEGYGYGGWLGGNLKRQERCMHGAWYNINDVEEECTYCHEIRERKNKTN
jgi:hypothetical protein